MRRLLLLSALLFVSLQWSAFSSAKDPEQVLSTRHFDIIYSPPSEAAALLLAEYADGFADEICSFLNAPLKDRIPVYLDARVEDINGYYTGHPYSRIYLYDTVPLEGSLAVFSDSLLMIFYHELTHAVSLTMRTPFWQLASVVFGDIVSVNQFFTMPLSFIEGVTVSFESAKGEGRLNDDRIQAYLVHERLSGRFLSWKEASGARDVYPGAKTAYIYGGAFSAWLQKEYGMERYARLWKTGSGLHILHPGLRAVFRDAYGETLDSAWTRFSESFALPVLSSRSPETVPGGEKGRFSVLTSGNTGVAWFDPDSGAVTLARDGQKPDRLFRASSGLHRLSFSPDGNFLLVSGVSARGRKIVQEVRVYDVENRRFTGERFSGLRDAAFAGDSRRIVGVRTRSQESSLVLLSRSGGEERTLMTSGLSERPGLVFSPSWMPSGSIAFLGCDGPNRWIGSVDPETGEVSLLTGAIPQVRDLQSLSIKTGDFLSFAWTGPQGLIRWGFYDMNAETFLLQEEDYPGVLHSPVLGPSGDSVVWIADFPDYRRLDRVPLNPASYAEGFPPTEQMDAKPVNRARNPVEGASLGAIEAKPYRGWKWFGDGFFYPLFSSQPLGAGNGEWTGGFAWITSDPGEFATLSFSPVFHVDPRFLEYSLSSAFAFDSCTVSAAVSDRLLPAVSVFDPYRELLFSTGISRTFTAWNYGTSLSSSLNAGVRGFAGGIVGADPYSAEFSTFSAFLSGELEFSDVKTTALQGFPLFRNTSTGWLSAVSGDLILPLPGETPVPALHGLLRMFAPVLPVEISLSASAARGLVFAPDGTWVNADRAREYSAGTKRYIPLFPEYKNAYEAARATDTAFGAVGTLKVLSLEIQEGVPLLPVYFNRFLMEAGYKGALFGFGGDPLWLDSVYGSASLHGTPIIGILSRTVFGAEFQYTVPLRGGSRYWSVGAVFNSDL
ncbi:hypothetical protein K7J14_08945 [Treponema zuelzerae]|uniref:Uncharacterized protein n=1 Tax=Teretinema zuelzerae TaxID=156 RepID=A0AAE3EJT9_9SPIR|nr:hypothetical protein [Teretinema zuelzerae]MCD1654829.1 hypothetical protein [Teretinema zuelzerae]